MKSASFYVLRVPSAGVGLDNPMVDIWNGMEGAVPGRKETNLHLYKAGVDEETPAVVRIEQFYVLVSTMCLSYEWVFRKPRGKYKANRYLNRS